MATNCFVNGGWRVGSQVGVKVGDQMGHRCVAMGFVEGGALMRE